MAGVCKRTKTHKEGGTEPSWMQTIRMPTPRLEDGVDSKYMIVEVWDQVCTLLFLAHDLRSLGPGVHPFFFLLYMILEVWDQVCAIPSVSGA